MGGPGSGRKKGSGSGKNAVVRGRVKGKAENLYANAKYRKSDKKNGPNTFIASSVKLGKGNKIAKTAPGLKGKVRKAVNTRAAINRKS